MTDSELLNVLSEVFSEELDRPGIVLSLADTNSTVDGWDSLAQVRIIAAMEDRLSIQFDMDEIESANSVSALMTAIKRHLA